MHAVFHDNYARWITISCPEDILILLLLFSAGSLVLLQYQHYSIYFYLLHSILFSLNRRESSKLNITIMYKLLLFIYLSKYVCMYLCIYLFNIKVMRFIALWYRKCYREICLVVKK